MGALLAGCPERAPLLLDHVVPGAGSARGGDEIRLVGTGFVEGSTVEIGGQRASASWFDASTVMAFTPRGFAGPVDVTLTRPDGATSTAEAGFEYVAFDVWFRDGLASALPIGNSALFASVGSADIDGDFDEDIVVAGPLIGAVLWENTELGRFAPAQQIPGSFSRVAVADFDGDGLADVFLCGAEGAFHRLMLGSATGLVEAAAGALPPLADPCAEAVVADLDGDGRPDLALLGLDENEGAVRSGLRVLLNRGSAGAPRLRLHDGIESAAPIDDVPFGAAVAEGSATDVQIEGTAGLGFGDASGRLRATFGGAGAVAGVVFAGVGGAQPVFEPPTGARVQLLGGGEGTELALELVDGGGERFTWSVGDGGGGASVRVAAGLDQATASGDGVFDLPVESVALRATATGPGLLDLAFDDLVLETEAGAFRIEDFERRTYAFAAGPAEAALAVGDLDRDGDVDLALGGPAGVRFGIQEPGAADAGDGAAGGTPAPAPPGVGAVRGVAVLPYESATDVLVVTDGAPSLLRMSGVAASDVTAELPPSFGAAVGALVGDLDRDGRPDVVVLHEAARDGILHRGATGWEDWTARLPEGGAPTIAATLLDADRDGDDDALLLSAGAAHRLLLSGDDPLGD